MIDMIGIYLKYKSIKENLFTRLMCSRKNQYYYRRTLKIFIFGFFIYFILNLFVILRDSSRNDDGWVMLYDDSSVNTSYYREEYHNRMEKLSEIVDQRNFDNRDKKVIIKNKRGSIPNDEYLILMYTKVFGHEKFEYVNKINSIHLKQFHYAILRKILFFIKLLKGSFKSVSV